MIFSSYYPDEIYKIPNVGHIVTYCDRLHPFLVEHRCIVDNNVLLQIRSESLFVEREKLEVLNWYPQVGDVCVAAAKPYLKWRKLYQDYALPEWMHKKMELLEIQGDMALVRPTNKQRQKIPFECLRVLEKNYEALGVAATKGAA
ncbi:MAG: hypothetical protein AAGD09_03420 [Cyanobacteria bacterium P01_F01_bin.56]